MEPHLFTPGPIAVPHAVRFAGAAPLIGHRSEPYFTLLGEIQGRLRRLLGTERPVVLLPSSGTGALEALIVNLLAPGERAISVSCGAFGDRFREIAARWGVSIHAVDIPWGLAAGPEDVLRALNECPDASALLLTHNETSTGVATDLAGCLAAVPPDGPLVLVDAVSSLGAMTCLPDAWGVDGLASCSQKGLMTPPGLGLVALSERGWHRASRRSCPSSFFDLSLHRRHLEKTRPDNPYTPPVSLLYSLAEALRFLDGFGHEAWFSERKRLASGFEAACEAMGLPLFVDDQALRSPVVTAVAVPQGAGKALRSAMETLGVTVAGGQSREPDLLRVGHYAPGGWPELCLLTGSVYGAGRRCGLPLMDGFLDAAWRCWSKEGAKEQ